MQSEKPFAQHKRKNKITRAIIIFLLLLLSLTIPAVMVTISFLSTDDIIVQDEEPLNKKQGLPGKVKPDGSA